jgi:F-type H+-transporting ATPase subunit b
MSLLSVSTTSLSGEARVFARVETALAEGAVNVDLDASFLVQVVIFLVLLAILKPLLFDPMLKLFEEREKRIEGTRREAAKEDKRSAEALAKYEAILAKAREAGNTESASIRGEGTKRETALLSEVRAQVTATLEEGRGGIAAAKRDASVRLGAEAQTLGREIAAKVLGRQVSP